jgi:hypothetical protein
VSSTGNEAARLIGIPIFYLNKFMEDRDIPHHRLLYDASAVRSEHNRLRELADAMNTFIPVEALEENGDSKSTDTVHVSKGVLEQELKAALSMHMCCQLDSELPT